MQKKRLTMAEAAKIVGDALASEIENIKELHRRYPAGTRERQLRDTARVLALMRAHVVAREALLGKDGE